MIAEPLRPLARPIGAFKLLDGNPRLGDVESVKRSLERFGQRKPIIARADGTVEAGNTTLRAALELGWDQIAAVAFEDDEATAKAFALADNRTSELGSFDLAALAVMAGDVHAADPELLTAASFTEADLAKLMAGQQPRDGQTDPDDVPEPLAEPVTQLGDLWLLDDHRLLCGDAADATSHDKLLAGERPAMLLMDPPYGMRLDTDFSTIKGSLRSTDRAQGTQGNKYEPVIGDASDYDPQPITGLYADVAEQFWWGADYYAERIPDRLNGSWLAWDKRKETQAEAVGSEFELCWSRRRHKRRMLRHEWFGFLSSESATEARNRIHPTQKPVALYADILTQWGKPGSLVLDTYAGSGTTIIACHRLGMRSAVMELSPSYCDVALRRYQEHVGIKPVLAATGRPHDFTATP